MDTGLIPIKKHKSLDCRKYFKKSAADNTLLGYIEPTFIQTRLESQLRFEVRQGHDLNRNPLPDVVVVGKDIQGDEFHLNFYNNIPYDKPFIRNLLRFMLKADTTPETLWINSNFYRDTDMNKFRNFGVTHVHLDNKPICKGRN
jgi:hypothetical protein